MVNKTNRIASFLYRLGEISEIPLRYVLNDIIGRWKTVLAPKQFGNASSKGAEILIRIALGFLFIALIVPVIVGSILWVVFRLFGDLALGKQSYLVLKGNYKGSGNNTFATWNVASFLPPPTLVDGVAYSNQRLIQIGKQLKDFHFVCAQEMGGPEARFVAGQLKDDFAEFYTYLGKSHAPFLQSGLFFASKEPVLNVYWYPYHVKGMQAVINRSFAVFELKNYYVALTHPDSAQGAAGAEVRKGELEQMLKTLEQFKDKPIIFCADLNADRYNNEPGYQLLVAEFPDVILNEYLACSNCGDLTNHSYCPNADKQKGNPNVPCITDTDLLAHNRFGKKTPVECLSIDFFGSNKLKLKLSGSAFFYELTDHHLMKGEIL